MVCMHIYYKTININLIKNTDKLSNAKGRGPEKTALEKIVVFFSAMSKF